MKHMCSWKDDLEQIVAGVSQSHVHDCLKNRGHVFGDYFGRLANVHQVRRKWGRLGEQARRAHCMGEKRGVACLSRKSAVGRFKISAIIILLAWRICSATQYIYLLIPVIGSRRWILSFISMPFMPHPPPVMQDLTLHYLLLVLLGVLWR
jgi:hypothetical protein